MARLNEPAAPIESVESLKRKFIRQNRDIARANSTQSLRIRNLENETSRLLAENLGLREQILRLQSELDNDKAQRIVDSTRVTKVQLEEKLLELGALISGLGEAPAQKKASPQTKKAAKASPVRDPAQDDWRAMYNIGDTLEDQEGRLPPILENKMYPRRTLERQELATLLSDTAPDTTDSPEIGPPPISQFVDEDPVKVDLALRPRKLGNEELLGLDPALSVNLEQRKKRRDSMGGLESRRSSKNNSDLSTKESTNPLKAGAKRKLAARDDDEREVSLKAMHDSPDDFKFTRVVSDDKSKNKAPSQPEKPSNRTAKEFSAVRGAPGDKQPSSAISIHRKVLAAKSVNGSPRKLSKPVSSDSIKASKPEISKIEPGKEHPQERKQVVELAKPRREAPKVHPEPETPAELDIFSPPSSHPSTARVASRDTPPPQELGPGTEGPRPSRRSRGSVSYAEPNLRDKMRRPTKEFVSAVAANAQSGRLSTSKLEGDSAVGGVSVKEEQELELGDEWKRMPITSSVLENSPLRRKAPVAETLPTSITTHRRRRESILQQTDTEQPGGSGAGSAIAALLAEKRKAKAEARGKGHHVNECVKAAESLDIYEFRGSSPPIEEAPAEGKEERQPSRQSRRHTSTVADIVHGDDSEASDIETLKKGRRQSTLGSRSSTASAESRKEGDGEKTLKKAISTAGMTDPAAGGSRSDRIAARRRSMML